MESDFERAAKRAVVDAVERRLDHNDKVRKRAELRRRLSSIGSVIIGLAVLTGIVMWLRGSGGLSKISAQVDSIRRTLMNEKSNSNSTEEVLP